MTDLMTCVCGSDDITPYNGGPAIYAYVRCTGCGRAQFGDTLAEVTAAWNTRHPTPAADEVEAVRAGNMVLKGEGTGLYSEAEGAIRQLIAAMQARSAEPAQDHWTVKALIKAGNALSMMAQTSGGTAGADPALIAAIEQWASVRRVVELEGGDPVIAAGVPAEPAGEDSVMGFREGLAFSLHQARYNLDAMDTKAAEILANVLARYDATPTNPERLVEALRAIANLQRHSREDDAENAQMMEDIARRALSAAPLKEGEGE